MTENEFHEKRKPFYIDSDTGLIKFPSAKYMNSSHAAWFSNDGIPYLHTVRGYFFDDFIMVYTNNFEIPNVSILTLDYLFAFFPYIKWIGLGCDRGEIGKVWNPKYKIYRDDKVRNS